MSQPNTTPSNYDTDLTQPGRRPDHGDAQPGQTGASGRDTPSDHTTDVPDDEASPGTPD